MRSRTTGAVFVLALALLTWVALVPPLASAERAGDRYALANGCWGLRSQALGRFVARSPTGFRAYAGALSAAEPFRGQATTLAQYLFMGRPGDFLAAAAGNRTEAVPRPGPGAEWRVEPAGAGLFRIVALGAGGAVLSASGPGGDLVVASAGAAGGAALFSFERTGGCAVFPEAQVNAAGRPFTRSPSYGEVAGYVDAHAHVMAFEFIGGRVRCGRPWHPFGITFAMVDCPDHEPGGSGAVLENALSGGSRPTHDTTGWPTFRDWPAHDSLTHEQAYYKGIERAWMGGLRLMVNLFVDNVQLCEVYPHKQNPCDEMDNIRLQARRLREFQDYIDAQNGGPGKGWFRIVGDPFRARQVVNQGKLAVIPGIETSRLFGCRVYNDVPECDRGTIDRELDAVHRMGVRQMEIINKFDNALGGVAGDAGAVGVVTNSGNQRETGRFIQFETCTGPPGANDEPQATNYPGGSDRTVSGIFQAFSPPGLTPLYPPPPHCNRRGLTDLGEHLIRRMMQRRMLIDPDHMSVLGRNAILALTESARYSGVLSSHSWSSPDAFPRIWAQGGIVTPIGTTAHTFVREARQAQQQRGRYYFGIGFGSDVNGFHNMPGPRRGATNPVRYPFRSFDGGVLFQRQRVGQRVYDINVDGVAHYGMHPDWLEDIRLVGGRQLYNDMTRSAEAYLQMWERAEGIPAHPCRTTNFRLTRFGTTGVGINETPDRVLRIAGQPIHRTGRVWRYCVHNPVHGPSNRGNWLTGVFTPAGRIALVTSNAFGHTATGIGRGARVSQLRRVRRFGANVFIRSAGGGTQFVFGVRRGRVRFIAVASRATARTPATLRSYLRLAGLS
jgi:hypothetical protein